MRIALYIYLAWAGLWALGGFAFGAWAATLHPVCRDAMLSEPFSDDALYFCNMVDSDNLWWIEKARKLRQTL